MTAPVEVTPVTPVGIDLEDGYKSLMVFGRKPNVALWVVAVKPFGYNGGEAIPQSNMHNNEVHTKAARSLVEITNPVIRVHYDPNCRSQIQADLVNRNGTITEVLPDGSAATYYGYLRTFDPAELVEGTKPEATCEVVVTNRDPTTGAEEKPVFRNVLGT